MKTLAVLVLVVALAGCMWMPQQDKMVRLDGDWHELTGCISNITKDSFELTTPDDHPVTVLFSTDRDMLRSLWLGQCVIVAGFMTASPEQFVGRAIRVDVGRRAVK
jgi:hypothetical protein